MSYVPFTDTYVMYQLLEFINESSIITLCKTTTKLNQICKQYIEMEDDKRFEIITLNDKYINGLFLKEYCKNNDVIKIRKLIKMDLNWNWGLYGACDGGHIDIVKLMIEKGADHLNYGLEGACDGGNINIINFMIEKGASNWNWGLWRACRNNNVVIIKLMIELGATKCYICNKSMEKHLIF